MRARTLVIPPLGVFFVAAGVLQAQPPDAQTVRKQINLTAAKRRWTYPRPPAHFESNG
jgi:hypothetical protein